MRRTLAGLSVVALVALGVSVSRAMMGAQAHHGHAAIATIDLLGFLTLGLLGGFGHCVGMCAPFVLFVGRRGDVAPGSARALATQGWYTLGRVTTYAALGAAAGALGGVVQLAGS